jgi:nucleoside-diphosphate-sugar epimerase
MKIGIGDLPQSDLDEILMKCQGLWDSIRGSKILILGGTGFVGTWILGGLQNANRALSLDMKITVVTRNELRARARFKSEDLIGLEFIERDLKTSTNLKSGFFDFAIHAATPSVPQDGFLDTAQVINSTTRGIDLIGQDLLTKNPQLRFVHTSSGAVYGSTNKNHLKYFETEVQLGDRNRTDYGNLKLLAERSALRYFAEKPNQVANPRLFTFLGPHLALDQHFAVGNFLQNGLSGNSIEIKGNPNSLRSYMYPTDLVSWLLNVMVRPNSGALNIGSEVQVSMLDLARAISELTSKTVIKKLKPESDINCYWPSTLNFQQYYGLSENITLLDGLERWIIWLEKFRP